MYTYTSFRVGCHLIPTTHNIPFFIPVLGARVLFIEFFPYPEACIFIADGRHLHHGHCNLLGCAAKPVAGASGGTLGYLGEAQLKPKQWKEKGETGQTYAENAEILRLKICKQWINEYQTFA